jgi:alanine racemase
MTPVVQLQLPIMQIKTIAAGESAGYSGSFIAERPTRLAIAFGGYADGLLRSLSHSGFAYCAGQKVPVAGKVSMDSMIFDITDISHTEHSPSIIDLIGPEQSIDDLANAANTIAYELLTSLGARFHRDYY